MASKADMNSIPPIWLSDKLENQIVVDSLRAYVRFLEGVIEKTENIGKTMTPNQSSPRNLSFEGIVETALEAHANIINRRSYRRRSDEVPSMISSGGSTPSPEVEVPLKKPKLEPLDDFFQYIESVKQEIITPEGSPVKSNPPLLLNHVTPPETPKKTSTNRKFSKSAFALSPKSRMERSSDFIEGKESSESPTPPLNNVTPPETPKRPRRSRKISKSTFAINPIEKKRCSSSKVVGTVPRFTFIGGFFATTYNLQRESVALALDFVGIKVELYRVKIVPNQNCRMYSLANEDLVRVTFEVDRKTTEKILNMFENDKCDLNFYKETEFSKKNKLTKELSDMEVLKWETMELMCEVLTEKYPKESGFRFESDEKSVELFKGNGKVWTIQADEFLLGHQEELRKAMEQLVEEGRELMEGYLEELKKKRSFKLEEI